MANIINQDSFGNTYFNYFDALTNGESANTNAQFFTYLETMWGVGRVRGNSGFGAGVASGVEIFYCTLPQTVDVLSPNINARYRFMFWRRLSGGNTAISSSNTNSDSSPNLVSDTSVPSLANPFITYAVGNASSLCFIEFSDANRNDGVFTYLGFLKSEAYSGSNKIRNFSAIRHRISSNTIAFHPANINTTSLSSYSISGGVANYSITCTNSTPDATTTDLVLRQSASPNYAIGSCYNLLKTSASVVIGQTYDIPNLVDGNTEQKRWLCVGNWGSEKLLMRVWTEGF